MKIIQHNCEYISAKEMYEHLHVYKYMLSPLFMPLENKVYCAYKIKLECLSISFQCSSSKIAQCILLKLNTKKVQLYMISV